MTISPEIAFDNMEPSEAVAIKVRDKTAKLEKLFGRMTHARVIIEAPHRHQHKGKIYHVKIVIGMPGRADLIVNHDSDKDQSHQDVHVALRDAFEATRRQLEETAARMKGQVKTKAHNAG